MDEPALDPDLTEPLDIGTEEAVPADPAETIRRLVRSQSFGVLCTQGGGQPYGSVVAFAFHDDLTGFVFATPKASRKYRLITECDHVALVVDSRSAFPGELMNVEAITVTGRVREMSPGAVLDGWAALLIARHPYLRTFVDAPSTALFRVDVVRFFHVTRFQEVWQWIPTEAG